MGFPEMSDPAERSLSACIGCHDQCMYASADVLASGRQELVISRLAAAVRSGPPNAQLTDALFMALDQGSQQRACIILDGSQDPRDWLREARSSAITASGHIPVPVAALRAARANRTPTAALNGSYDCIVVVDALTGSRDETGTRNLVDHLAGDGARVGLVRLASAGTLEHFAGLAAEREELIAAAQALLAPWSATPLVSDDPAVCYASRFLWGDATPPVAHVAEYLAQADPGAAPLVEGLPSPGPVVVNDVGLLAGDLGVHAAVRSLLRAAGYPVLEAPSSGRHAREDGPMFGYPDPRVAATLARARYDELAATGAQAIITLAPWSRHNLAPVSELPLLTLTEALAAASRVERAR
ncbi:MAG: hypothetical protein ACK5LS_00810 [Propioniciclava sp.]